MKDRGQGSSVPKPGIQESHGPHLEGVGSKAVQTVKILYQLATPYHPGMDRAINQIFSTKGIKGIAFQGLSTVEIEYDSSRLTHADVDRLLSAGLHAMQKS